MSDAIDCCMSSDCELLLACPYCTLPPPPAERQEARLVDDSAEGHARYPQGQEVRTGVCCLLRIKPFFLPSDVSTPSSVGADSSSSEIHILWSQTVETE